MYLNIKNIINNYQNYPNIKVFCGYTIFFIFLYLQYPLTHSLPGNTDTWLVISLSNQYLVALERIFDSSVGFAMHPIKIPFFYGEASPGCALIYLFFKLIFFGSDIWGYFAYLVFILSSTAFALYRLCLLIYPAEHGYKINCGAIFAGFAFTNSNIIFAHIDDSIIYFYPIPFVAANFLIRFCRENDWRLLYTASILGGIQIYFSLYVFIYQSIFLFLLFVFNFRFSTKQKNTFQTLISNIKYFIFSATTYCAIPLPFLVFYYYGLQNINILNPFDLLHTAMMASLHPFDYVATTSENLIWGSFWQYLPQNWGYDRHRNFIGAILLIMGICGLILVHKSKYCLAKNFNPTTFLFLILAGIIMGMGPFVITSTHNIANSPPSPINFFYTTFPILAFIRVPSRAYFLVLMVMSISAGFSLNILINYVINLKVFQKTNHKTILIILNCIIFLGYAIENIPFPAKKYSITNQYPINDEYLELAKIIKRKIPKPLILDLPTSFTMRFVGNKQNWQNADPNKVEYKYSNQPKLELREASMFNQSGLDLYQYNREIIYTYWQSQHKLSIINGLNGYFSLPRAIYQFWIVKLPTPVALAKLKSFGVNTIVYHKKMLMKNECLYPKPNSRECNVDGEIRLVEEDLDGSSQLEKIFSGNNISAYQIK